MNVGWTSGARGALVAPVVTLNTSNMVLDPLFSNSDYHPSRMVSNDVDANGVSHTLEEGNAWYKAYQQTSSYTRSTDNTYQVTTHEQQQVTTADSSYQFQALSTVDSHLHSEVTVTTVPNFLLITSYPNTTAIDLTRKIRVVVDQPMQMLITLAGRTSAADFKEMFTYLQVRGGTFSNPVESLFSFNSTANQAADVVSIHSNRSKLGVDCAVEGMADPSAIQLTLDLKPTVADVPATIEVQWAIRNNLNGGTMGALYHWNRNIAASAEVNETLKLNLVPEPGVATCLLGAAGMIITMRRRR